MAYNAGRYDVIVIGGGHAGCEAALAAARLGCRTLMLTLNLENIALMPCNPSVGGPGKGQLVREVDALGGQMALVTDQAALQIRELNSGKGPAVRALRAQVDKRLYQALMRRVLEHQERLDIRQGMVVSLKISGGQVQGVVLANGIEFAAGAVVLASGVYLDSRVITGEAVTRAGPSGQIAACGLSDCLRGLGLRVGRFKTGTPPRVDGRTVDFSVMERQDGSSKPLAFSFMNEGMIRERQLPCWLTHTTEATHRIIRENIHRAPMFNGLIEGRGPRYCPSIEDKVVRFPDKSSHQVFIEPEGWDTAEMYVQGLSTSLPEEVQVEILRTVPGLERARMMRAGYAIEYDYLDPSQLALTLESRVIQGLFCAGQVNGTSGYEEAAAQGLVAGINAACKVKGREPLVLSRSEAYIGVMIDDLVTRGVDEPYRMLTGRAEFRLSLRQDNADLRLTEKGRRVGLVSDERYRKFIERKECIDAELNRLRCARVAPAKVSVLGVAGADEARVGAVTLADLLRRPGITYERLAPLDSGRPHLPSEVTEEVEIILKYEGYVAKERIEVERMRRLESRRIPESVNYNEMKGLSNEARELLNRVRPVSVGQAMRIPGIAPADIAVLLCQLERYRRWGEAG